MVDTVIVENEQAPSSAVSWGAILAGSAVMGALSLLLLALGTGIGFSVIDPWSPGGLPETTKAATVAGIYLTVTAVLAGALGGYITGRMRNLWPGVHPHEAFFRDTAHGFVAWAVAVIASAAFLAPAAAALTAGVPAVRAENAAMSRSMAQLAPDRAAVNEDRRAAGSTASAMTAATPADPQAMENARRIAKRISFWLVASMFAGALAAGLGAWEGGGIRDGRYRYGS
jgi:hypothetical protein